MPGGRDSNNFNARRPPRRKSWDEEGTDNEAGVDRPYRASDYDPKPERPLFPAPADDEDASPARNGSASGRSTSASRMAGRGGASAEARGERRDGFEDDKKERAKQGRKRLFKLLGNQALCLLIIFGLIGTCNWIATDYSGDYLGQNRLLRMVQLTITRRATTMDAELNYGMSGLLELDQSKDHPSPKEDKTVTLYFVTPEQWRQPGRKIWHATFKGRIDGGKAVGTISDAQGNYKVSLEKNVLTSMFRHAQTNIPKVPEVPLPSLFDETEKSKTLTNTGSNAYGTYQNQNQNRNQNPMQNPMQNSNQVRTSSNGQLFGTALSKPSNPDIITGVKINR